MRTVLITGGTGLVGRALTRLLLQKGYSVIVLTRSPDKKKPDHPALSYAGWSVARQDMDAAAFSRADYIVHLAGEAIADQRWTAKRKRAIVSSRVQSSQMLVRALQEMPNHVKAVVSASAIGWYGPDPVVPNPEPFNEEAAADPGFLGTTCKAWEAAIDPVEDSGRRLVKLRTGLVLSKDGGLFHSLKKSLNFGIAPVLGGGRQVISWIHMADLVSMYVFAIENENVRGIYNAVAPAPVSQKTFMKHWLRYKSALSVPVPSFVLKVVLGEMSVEVLKSATVSADKIKKAGYSFQLGTIDAALKNLTDPSSPHEIA